MVRSTIDLRLRQYCYLVRTRPRRCYGTILCAVIMCILFLAANLKQKALDDTFYFDIVQVEGSQRRVRHLTRAKLTPNSKIELAPYLEPDVEVPEGEFRYNMFNKFITNNLFVTLDFFEEIANIVIMMRANATKLYDYAPKEEEIPIIFINSDILDVMRDFVKINTFKYILITGYSIHSIPVRTLEPSEEHNYTDILLDPNLVHWFGKNVMMSHPKLTGVPVGFVTSLFKKGNQSNYAKAMIEDRKLFQERNIGIYVNFDDANHPERKTWREMFCAENSIFRKHFKVVCIADPKLPQQTYLRYMGNTKFVISPPGRGMDCHRTWEALAMGAVPVVLNSELRPLYEDERLLMVEKFEEVTPELLYNFAKHHPESRPTQKIFAYYWRDIIETKRKEAQEKMRQKFS